MINHVLYQGLPGEIYSSIIVVIIIAIISSVVYFKVKKTDPLAKPKGIVHLAEILVSTMDNLAKDFMGPKLRPLASYFTAIAIYIAIGFIFGLTGLPSPITYLMVPLMLAFLSFIGIHIIAIRYQKWRYFKRYTSPFFLFLPINVITVFAPILSLSLRLFGNALAGTVLMGLVYYFLQMGSAALFSFLPAGFNSIFLAPIITPWLHLYFDLVTAFIQTLVFISLSMIFIGNETFNIEDTDKLKQVGNET
jgi:F-type H+-transporting ATPase subunit a